MKNDCFCFFGHGEERNNLKSGLWRVALFVLRVIDVTLLLFLPLVGIIMTSQRALLVVYLVSLVCVRSAKRVGARRSCPGEHGPGHPIPEASL